MNINKEDLNKNLENFKKEISNIEILWKQILSLLNSENLFYKEEIEDNGLIKEISQNIDLNDIYNENFESWNNSVNKLKETLEDFSWQYIYKKDTGDSQDLLFWNSDTLKKVDAGKSFSEINNCVIPWLNYDQKSYVDVRDSDLNNEIILSNKKLQFTCDNSKEPFWTRLIMPQNTRHVHVEDLNRNFWVIGQNLSIVCTYLFDEENAPIQRILEKFLNEITQLWDNTLHLWLSCAVVSQKHNEDIKVICLPLPKSKIEPYTSMNRFDKETYNKEEVIKKIDYLRKKYNKSHLIVLPYVRKNNYYRNYYEKIVFPYICMYDRNKNDEWFINSLKILSDSSNSQVQDFAISIISNSGECIINNKIYALCDKEDDIRYAFPFSRLSPQSSNNFTDVTGAESEYYYSLIRPTFYINAFYRENELQIGMFRVDFEDVAREMLNKNGVETSQIENISSNKTNIVCSIIKPSNENFSYNDKYNENLQPYTLSCVNLKKTEVDGIKEMELPPISFVQGDFIDSYYKGEIISYRYKPEENISVQLKDSQSLLGDGILLKIGNFLPKVKNNVDLSNYINEQQTPSSAPTAFKYNLTFNETALSNMNSIFETTYGTLSSPSTPQQCYFYKTQINTNKSGYYTHNEEGVDYYSYDQINLDKLEEIGKSVIKEYVNKTMTNKQKKQITYFICSAGIIPWQNQNTKPSSYYTVIHQGYWQKNLLTHLFRFVPVDRINMVYGNESQIERLEKVYDSSSSSQSLLGYIDYSHEINRTESAFRDDNDKYCFVSSYVDSNGVRQGTTWRLPKLFPQTELGSYLTIEIWRGSSRTQGYVILPNQWGNYQFSNFDLNDLTEAQQNAIEEFLLSDDCYVYKDFNEIRGLLSQPSGTWSVFDGQSTANSSGNKENWKNNANEKYREAGRFVFDFSIEDGESTNWYSTASGYIRNLNQSTMQQKKITPSILWNIDNILPNGNNYSAGSWG